MTASQGHLVRVHPVGSPEPGNSEGAVLQWTSKGQVLAHKRAQGRQKPWAVCEGCRERGIHMIVESLVW